ncbi:hypothetical protein U9M48_016889, partial [Paspalum notatum var. saurae]
QTPRSSPPHTPTRSQFARFLPHRTAPSRPLCLAARCHHARSASPRTGVACRSPSASPRGSTKLRCLPAQSSVETSRCSINERRGTYPRSRWRVTLTGRWHRALARSTACNLDWMTAPCPNQIIDATTGRTPPPSRLSTPSSPSTSSIAPSMDQINNNGGRTPFTDISNNIGGDQDEQKLQSPTIDAKERKRQRDRERYASMSVEKRKDINKKRREACQRNK